MATTTYSVTCVSSQEQQQMLLKSLIGILGLQTHSETEWTYVDERTADIVIVDYDDGMPTNFPSAIVVGFSRDINLIKEVPFSLHKPLRSRDLVNLLTELESHLSSKKRQNISLISTQENAEDDPLDLIYTLIKNNTQSMFSLHFDDQVVYLDPSKKKFLSSTPFSYTAINPNSDFQYHSLPVLPNSPLKPISFADFFYEFTLSEKNAHLLAGLSHDARFQIKQWPNFTNAHNTKAALKISAYFSKQKATLQTAAQDLSLDIQQLFGFINAVHAQNLLMFDYDTPVPVVIDAPNKTMPVTQESKKVSGLFGRIRQRFGL